MFSRSLKSVIERLESLFSKFNEHFYNNELISPILTVSPDTTKGAYGWCTSWKAWKNGTEGGYFEINICAEHLSRPFIAVCETLLHEMVHLYNVQCDIKDTSRGGTYHNAKFKDAAELHGLIVEKTKNGWGKTALNEETAAWLFPEMKEEIGFELHREKPIKLAGKKQSSRKYVCPECGTIVRATKEVHIECGECGLPFEER